MITVENYKGVVLKYDKDTAKISTSTLTITITTTQILPRSSILKATSSPD